MWIYLGPTMKTEQAVRMARLEEALCARRKRRQVRRVPARNKVRGRRTLHGPLRVNRRHRPDPPLLGEKNETLTVTSRVDSGIERQKEEKKREMASC